MNLGLEALSKTVIWSKYAKYVPELNRRETWDEIIDRLRINIYIINSKTSF